MPLFASSNWQGSGSIRENSRSKLQNVVRNGRAELKRVEREGDVESRAREVSASYPTEILDCESKPRVQYNRRSGRSETKGTNQYQQESVPTRTSLVSCD